MQKLSINKISKNFFRTSPQKIESYQSNPFGVSFKGSVLTADVFETKKSVSLIKHASKKGKILTSAIVGSISKLNSAVGTRLNSAVTFGNRIKNNISDLWNQAKSIEITFEMPSFGNIIKSKIASRADKNSAKEIAKLPVAEIETMFENELAKV